MLVQRKKWEALAQRKYALLSSSSTSSENDLSSDSSSSSSTDGEEDLCASAVRTPATPLLPQEVLMKIWGDKSFLPSSGHCQ
jgi:E3 ubiquitin-protein ligase Arkadia